MTDNDNKLLGVVPKTRKNGKSAKKFKIVKVKGKQHFDELVAA